MRHPNRVPGATDGTKGSAYSTKYTAYTQGTLTDKNGVPVPTGSNAQKVLNDLASIYVKDITAPLDFDHIIGADFNAKSGLPTGGHSLVKGDVKIIPGTTTTPDSRGVYEASVQMRSADGAWIDKKTNSGVNTMFPVSWTEARIKVEVDAAWNRPGRTLIGKNQWEGVTPSGVTVRGFISPNTTAFPVYKP